jgi:hypothetical protein
MCRTIHYILPAVVSVLPRPPYGMPCLLMLDLSILCLFFAAVETILFRVCLRPLANVSAHQIRLARHLHVGSGILNTFRHYYWLNIAEKLQDVPAIQGNLSKLKLFSNPSFNFGTTSPIQHLLMYVIRTLVNTESMKLNG